jgi:acetyltransferase-like isoleucine patch superfamily enzyme
MPVVGVPNPTGVWVGSGVEIGPYAFLEALAPQGEVVLRVGDGSYIGPFARITAIGGVTIGRKVLIADRCYLSDSGHEYEDPDLPIIDQGMRHGRSVTIGDGAWLGVGAVVVGDVTIGRNAVVGANSVVRSSVPDLTVVAGDPAVPIRTYVDGRWQRV